MRIDKVIIKNFRNYLGEHVFDLSKDITVFYGENGYGKSSFFDALEWCISGTVSRFSDEDESERLKKDLVNRYVILNNKEETVECSVIIEFNGNKLIRKFNVLNNIYGHVTARITDSNDRTRRDASKKLINSKDRVDKFLSGEFHKNQGPQKKLFGKLMKQTYILSQDQVTDFITSDNSVETFRSIANIMGFQPLLNLSDNIKKIHSALNSNNKKFKEEVEARDRAIASKQETKREVDIFKLNIDMNALKINTDTQIPKLKEQLSELRKNILTKILKYENLLDISSNLELQFKDVNELTKKIDFLKTKEKELNVKLQSYHSLNSDVELRIEELKKLLDNFIEYKKRSIRVNQINEKLSNLNFSSEVKNIDIIKKELEKIKNLQLKYRYAKLNSNNYKQYKEINAIHPKKLLAFYERLKYLSNILKKRNNLLKLINGKLVQTENGVLINLLNNIKEIHKYLQHNNHDEKCPVCSTVKEEGLIPAVNQNLDFYSQQIHSTSNYAEKLLNLKNKISNSVQQINNEIKEIEEDIKMYKHLLKSSEKGLNKIERNNLFDKELIIKDIGFLDKVSASNESQINKLDEAINLLFELEKLRQENKLGSRENLSSSEEDINQRILRLKKAKSRIENRNVELQHAFSIKKEIKSLESNLQQFIENTESLKLNIYSFDLLKNELSSNLNNEKTKLNMISNVETAYELIDHNKHIDQQIQKLNTEKAKLYDKVNKLSTVIDSLSEYMSTVFGDFGNNAKDYLNNYSSPIQKYFRYLNPLPNRSTVRFEGEEDNLLVKVIFDESEDEGDITSPRNVLSSGQLNVLAISIFLAMNDSQKIHELDFMAIDDPIQNMDDVNQFSICDVLGSIKKQLIFSTHDFEFLKLFIKKNEYKKENIQIYNFKSPFLLPDKVEHIHFAKDTQAFE
ncbi:hypothetical protein ACTL7R_00345 [Priestia aryabhattai]|uniref:hypothetical protein n=1 Tax=Priestia TaxID=2800373 RepID=UPI003F895BD5